MTPQELASFFEMAAQALRAMPGAPGSLPLPAENTRTLNDWMAIHEEQIMAKGYKTQTIRNRTANLNHVKRLWGERPLGAIRAHEVSSALREEFLPAKVSTAQRVLGELREAFNEAIANDWVGTNPAAHVKLPTCRVKRKRLSMGLWQRLLVQSAHQQPWVRPMLLLALSTGQRRADVCKMRFSDVHDGHLHVEQQKQAGKGYGARVAIPIDLRLDVIGLSLAEIIEECRAVGKAGDTLLRKADGRPLEESSLTIRFADCIRAVCPPDAYAPDEWPSLHEVRSLSARAYMEQGLSQSTVQTLLGHKHAEMTALYQDDRGLTAKEYKRVR